ncbi:MAG: tetratricopeptide repeat protein, partial [Fulvivirga sp.]
MKYNILLFFVLMHTFCFGKHQSILDLATKFFNNGQYDSAHYYLDQIFESDPNNTSAIKLRADTYSYQGDNLKAIDNYQRFIYLEKNKISPDYNLLSFVQNSLSWTYYAMGLYSKSIEIYRMALKT